LDIIKIKLGKLCKTGRPVNNVPTITTGTQNNASTYINNNHNTISTPASAPPQTNYSSPSTSSSTTPAETLPLPPHPASALSTHHHSFSSKNANNPVTLRLRREMTQPTMSRIELISSDTPLGKIAANDSFPFQFRSNNNNINKLNPNQQYDIRSKQLKISSNRVSVDYLPVRQLSRSKLNDPLPSPKGKKKTPIFILIFSLIQKLLFLNSYLKINSYFVKI
jgi:hypothetical protein